MIDGNRVPGLFQGILSFHRGSVQVGKPRRRCVAVIIVSRETLKRTLNSLSKGAGFLKRQW